MNGPQKSDSGAPTTYDVAVIGGGPAGMMAAATAGAAGKRVVLLEKNPDLGKKLLITGGGRCNVTNKRTNVRDMLAQYGSAGKFLFSTFTQHGVCESIDWFQSRGIALHEENEGRLFPDSNSARTIRDILAVEAEVRGVTVKKDFTVTEVKKDSQSDLFTITAAARSPVLARSVVVATGGTARPETGSSGEGFSWLAAFGHTVVPNNYALVPVALRDTWTKRISGLTLPDVKITVYAEHEKQLVGRGKLLFTHVGVTGPTILNMSKTIGELLAHSTVSLLVDLFPDQDAGELKGTVQELLIRESNKKLKNALAQLVPAALVSGLLEMLAIDGETPGHSVRKEERVRLIALLKAVPLQVQGLLGPDKAVISAGGIPLEEVDPKTMQSRILPGLFLVGDVLNINRPSGGYSLQLCWSTGYVAGSHA